MDSSLGLLAGEALEPLNYGVRVEGIDLHQEGEAVRPIGRNQRGVYVPSTGLLLSLTAMVVS
jgi:hypothetical protein